MRKIIIAIITTAMITVTIMSNPITSPGTLKGKPMYTRVHARTLAWGKIIYLDLHTSFSYGKERIMFMRL